jgi:hypothetical protein
MLSCPIADIHAPETGECIEQLMACAVRHVHALSRAKDRNAPCFMAAKGGRGMNKVLAINIHQAGCRWKCGLEHGTRLVLLCHDRVSAMALPQVTVFAEPIMSAVRNPGMVRTCSIARTIAAAAAVSPK